MDDVIVSLHAMDWTADFVNDPGSDFDLCIDIMEGDIHRATLSCDKDGTVKMVVYPSSIKSFAIPVSWLAGVLQVAMEDLQRPLQAPG